MSPRAQPDVHHDCARLQWELHRNGEPFSEGTDILTCDLDGRIVSVVTFLDRRRRALTRTATTEPTERSTMREPRALA